MSASTVSAVELVNPAAPMVIAQAVPMVGAAMAPVGDAMERAFGNKPNMVVKQTRRGCVQELLGCEAKTEMKLHTMEDRQNQWGYSIEESNCCIRICFPANRPLTMHVNLGVDANGEQVMKAVKPCNLCMANQCCFSTPMMDVQRMDGQSMGTVTTPFVCCRCVPEIKVQDATGTTIYDIAPPVCCGGMCINVFHSGCCNKNCLKLPLFVYPEGAPRDNTTGELVAGSSAVGAITKEWRGLGTEMFSDADTFAVQFPPGIDTAKKALLLAATFLVNVTMFEKQQ